MQSLDNHEDERFAYNGDDLVSSDNSRKRNKAKQDKKSLIPETVPAAPPEYGR
jgi:hypothetical protein